jgi:hypothetical protein
VTDLQVRYIDEQSTVIAERRVRFADRHDVTLRVMYLDRTESGSTPSVKSSKIWCGALARISHTG